MTPHYWGVIAPSQTYLASYVGICRQYRRAQARWYRMHLCGATLGPRSSGGLHVACLMKCAKCIDADGYSQYTPKSNRQLLS